MRTLYKKAILCSVITGFFVVSSVWTGSIQNLGMGKAEMALAATPALEDAPSSDISLAELAKIYWPDSNATEVQKEETLKNLLGKRVTWEITVAEIQRHDKSTFLVQGQSDETMLGTFSYVQPQNEAETKQILSASRGSKLNITGIVSEMQMRHLVLKPARLAPVAN